MAGWYPIILQMDGRRCIVVGGGAVAQRKSEGLLQAKADIRVISPKLTPVLQEWANAGLLQWDEREAKEEDLDGATLVFAATDRPEVNRWIAEIAGLRGIPYNIADNGEEGDFLVPAVLRQGDLILAASASGAGPALAKRIINELAERYGPEYDENVKALRTIREIVKSEISDITERRELLQVAVTDEALEEWRSAAWIRDKDRLIARLRQRVNDRKG
ncbi:precorrin-2 dehydrogenase/sirohydrochlorin ferrochelatase family protein [Cohnella lupini]|uniref:precorrin-2 dehydrogenase n=1 Tax=Cohnella lupini TaxID=1294267 RepID=A0A3D9IRE8_9BACL|nr:bifunctional precorrin-2 dehydrogenase/sirohydrochlorin ferrochelatase [Cohnella lupini]RED64099.1 precorrin-2 dehydrogenase/sirohydrochlorin ferrochelatase [Cohnella lupini]